MKRINSLGDLLMEELADLLDAENQLVEALPKMVENSQSSALKESLVHHLEVTKKQAHRLQDIFSNIGQNTERGTCKAIKELIKEGEYVVKEVERGPIRDAAIISVAQRVEHYEISGYETACEHALSLGHTRIVELLNETLNEERAMKFYLNELSQSIINAQAIQPRDHPQESKGSGFYIPEGKYRRGGIKKKTKGNDVSRFISEGNPNLQNPEEQGDLS